MSQRKGTAARSAAASSKEQVQVVDASVSDSPSLSLATDPLPTVRVNKSHLAEIKTSLDDIVKKVCVASTRTSHTCHRSMDKLTKQYLADQAFTPSHLHATVHLVCGYASCLISLGAFLYTYLKGMTFEESKPYLWIGVIAYGAFQSALWAWKRWVERGEVFRGRRRRVVKRVSTFIIFARNSTADFATDRDRPHSDPHFDLPSPSSGTGAQRVAQLAPFFAGRHDVTPLFARHPEVVCHTAAERRQQHQAAP